MNNRTLSMKYRAPTEGGEPAGAGPDTDIPAAPTSEPSEDSSAVNDWEGLSSDDDSGDVSIPEPAVAPTTPAPEVQAPAAPVAPEAPQVAAEPVVPPPAPAQQPTTEQPVAAPDMAVLRQNYQNELTSYYALSQEDAQRLQTEPELVLPTLAAKVHLDVLDAVMAQLPQRVNMMINHHAESTKRERAAEDEFFAPFPDLKGHKDAVLRVGLMYRAANPTATKEQTIKAVGDFVRQSLGLQPPAPQTPPPVVVPKNPFTPAGGSGGGAPPQVASEWDFIMQEDE